MHQSNGAQAGNLSDLGAIVNMCKFCIGLGIISLPHVTSKVGWLTSVVGLAGIGALTLMGICFGAMVRSKLDDAQKPDVLDEETTPLVGDLKAKHWTDFPDYGMGCFDRIVGQVFGQFAQWLCVFCLAGGQFMTAVVYIFVIMSNVEEFFHGHGSIKLQVALVLSFVLCCLSMIPTLRGIAVLSALGLSIYLFLYAGFITELGNKAWDGHLPADIEMVKPDMQFGAWFGVSCFAFCGFPIAMAIYDEMAAPRNFYKVMSCSFGLVWAAYATFAVLGYACYGAKADYLVYMNFPEGSAFREGSSVSLALVLTFSYAVQMMPVFNCAAAQCHRVKLFEGCSLAYVRLPLVCLTVFVSCVMPNMRVLLNTLGAICGVLIGFIIPAATYWKVSSSSEWKERFVCFLLIALGVAGTVTSFTSHE